MRVSFEGLCGINILFGFNRVFLCVSVGLFVFTKCVYIDLECKFCSPLKLQLGMRYEHIYTEQVLPFRHTRASVTYIKEKIHVAHCYGFPFFIVFNLILFRCLVHSLRIIVSCHWSISALHYIQKKKRKFWNWNSCTF